VEQPAFQDQQDHQVVLVHQELVELVVQLGLLDNLGQLDLLVLMEVLVQ
jgi:hypothetical protein